MSQLWHGYSLSRQCSADRRQAIVDFDVHHGNGTEEIVRARCDPAQVLFFSIHLYDKGKGLVAGPRSERGRAAKFEFYPGSGAKDSLGDNVVNVPLLPLWRVPERESPIGTRHAKRPGRYGSPVPSAGGGGGGGGGFGAFGAPGGFGGAGPVSYTPLTLPPKA